MASGPEEVGVLSPVVRRYMAFLGSRANGAKKRRGDPAYYRRLSKRGWRIRRSRVVPTATTQVPDKERNEATS